MGGEWIMRSMQKTTQARSLRLISPRWSVPSNNVDNDCCLYWRCSTSLWYQPKHSLDFYFPLWKLASKIYFPQWKMMPPSPNPNDQVRQIRIADFIKKTVAKRRFDAKIQNDNDRAWSFIFHHKDQYFSLYLQLGKLSNFRFEQDWAIENQFPPSVVMKLDIEGRCISTLSFEESNLKKRNYWFVKQTNSCTE